MMTNQPIDVLTLLDLEPIEVNLFRGISPHSNWPRVYGGQVIAQAMVAACRTVEKRLPHSLHAYFILPGDPLIPIIYEVGRLRDGRSFSTRRVTAIQHGQAIFSMIVSFTAAAEAQLEYQETMPDVPPPEAFTTKKMRAHKGIAAAPDLIRHFFTTDESKRRRPIELRPTEVERYLGQQMTDGRVNIWMRVNAKLPDDPAIHLCALAYASDLSLLDAALARSGRTFLHENLTGASLDHAMWFHRPARADEWLLYSQDSPNANHGRALTRGLIFRPDGTLVASVAQEGVIRARRPGALKQSGPPPLAM